MPSLDDTIFAIAGALHALDPGPLAQLRRMEMGGPGAPMFWRLAAQHDFGDEERLIIWERIVRIMAILTPRGERSPSHRLHDKHHRLGAALCDGGNPGWGGGGEARPVLSEQRLAKLLTSRDKQRAQHMERACRALARTRNPAHGVNCTDIAAFLLFPTDPKPMQHMAQAYYARLERSTRNPETDRGGNDQ